MTAISEEIKTSLDTPFRAAALDIGSNSCRILIAEVAEPVSRKAEREAAALETFGNKKVELIPIYYDLKTTRLAAGIEENGRLNSDSLERTIAALKNFRNKLQKYQVSRYRMVGTSALREVSDASRLAAVIEAETGLELKIISGQREAELVYQGASAGFENFSGGLVIDIGGGSTEIITKKSGSIFPVSLRMGAVRFTERYITDPARSITEKEITSIREATFDLLDSSSQLSALEKPASSVLPKTEKSSPKSSQPEEVSKPDEVSKSLAGSKKSYQVPEKSDTTSDKSSDSPGAVGVGGTITTLAAVQQEMSTYHPELIEGYYLSREEVETLIELFASRVLEERQAIIGLQPARADIITAGTVILSVLLKFFQLPGIRVSEQDILYGLVREELKL